MRRIRFAWARNDRSYVAAWRHEGSACQCLPVFRQVLHTEMETHPSMNVVNLNLAPMFDETECFP